MRVAITGASGFIGSEVARALAARGDRVTALVRATSRRDHLEPSCDRFVEGTQDDPAVLDALLDGADALVHSSFDWEPLRADDLERHRRSNLLGTLELLDRLESRPVVYMSTIAVHHDILPDVEGVIDERHPLRPGNEYGATKAAIEAHLWSRRFHADAPFVAVRPCAVYGQDPRPERTIGWPIVGRLREQGRYARRGGGKFVHVEDVALATLGGLDRLAADGAAGSGVCNLADCYARWSDWARMTAACLGIEGEVEIDERDPPQSRNRFDVAAGRALGARLDRGHDGIRAHVADLVARIDAAGA